MKKIILLTLGVAMLAGCQNLLTSSQKQLLIYAMRYQPAGEGASSTHADPMGVLLVTRPAMAAGLMTDKYALYVDDGRRQDFYANARWVQSLDDVIQNITIQAGRETLPGMVVDTPQLNVTGNYRLAVKVMDFAPYYKADSDAMPYLKVAMNFTLIKLPEKTIMKDFVLESGKQADGNNLTAITAGLESLLQSSLDNAYDKIGQSIAEHQRTIPLQ